jgi:hypothetical protein
VGGEGERAAAGVVLNFVMPQAFYESG